jgi:hypothetical protein
MLNKMQLMCRETAMQEHTAINHPHFRMLLVNCLLYEIPLVPLLLDHSNLRNDPAVHDALPVEKDFNIAFTFTQSCQNFVTW